MEVARYCVLELKSGLAAVKLTLDNFLMCGGDFRIYNEKNDVVESWKMSADSTTFSKYTIKRDPSLLHKYRLVFQILVCSKKPTVSAGSIQISIFQNQQACKITVPPVWDLKSIPPCSISKSVQFDDNLTFITKE